MYQHLEIERMGNITIVWLNRPAAANALNTDIMTEVEMVSRSFLDDEETRVVIFAGRGKHFSAGADLKEPPAEESPSMIVRRRRAGLGGRMIKAILEINQVTIAAVHGAALGGGACIPTACDFRIGTGSCVMGYPEVNLGINLQWTSLPLAVRLVGPARAKRMIMLGLHENAETLLEWGMLDQVVDDDELMTAALEMARAYAGQPPIAMQMIKQSINAVANALDPAVMHMDVDQNILTTLTEDRSEAIAAFFEKREGKYQGR